MLSLQADNEGVRNYAAKPAGLKLLAVPISRQVRTYDKRRNPPTGPTGQPDGWEAGLKSGSSAISSVRMVNDLVTSVDAVMIHNNRGCIVLTTGMHYLSCSVSQNQGAVAGCALLTFFRCTALSR